MVLQYSEFPIQNKYEKLRKLKLGFVSIKEAKSTEPMD